MRGVLRVVCFGAWHDMVAVSAFPPMPVAVAYSGWGQGSHSEALHALLPILTVWRCSEMECAASLSSQRGNLL